MSSLREIQEFEDVLAQALYEEHDDYDPDLPRLEQRGFEIKNAISNKTSRILARLLETGAMPLAREGRLLNEEEQAIMDRIGAVLDGIKKLGLREDEDGYLNGFELVHAVHILQSFVVQHMLQRLEPDRWGNWFEDPGR